MLYYSSSMRRVDMPCRHWLQDKLLVATTPPYRTACSYEHTPHVYVVLFHLSQHPAILPQELHYEASQHGRGLCRPSTRGHLLAAWTFPVPPVLWQTHHIFHPPPICQSSPWHPDLDHPGTPTSRPNICEHPGNFPLRGAPMECTLWEIWNHPGWSTLRGCWTAGTWLISSCWGAL